jgi:ABC-2 type transport system ATP-binding protein
MHTERVVPDLPTNGTAQIAKTGCAPGEETAHAVVVDVRGLRKVYTRKKMRDGAPFWTKLVPGRQPVDEFVAVASVDFSIREGEIFGLLGPNGAGKTTTIKMLCTLLEPTSGAATICGYDIARQPGLVRQNLGAVLTGERSIYWKLTARENLEYFAALYHIPPAVARKRIGELLARLNLSNRADELVERYSSGMKQRVALAKALLANPPVLLLDEPTIGLDPQSARNLRELILEIKQEGRTVLITTHYMEEADLLSDRIGIIDTGRIIALDTPANLKKSINQLDILQLEVENYDPVLNGALGKLPTVQNVVVREADTDSAALALHATDSRLVMPGLIEAIGTRAGRITHLEVAQPTLEDVFISLTGKQLRE